MKGEFIKLRDFIAARGTILNVGLLIHYLIYGHLTIKFREFSRPEFIAIQVAAWKQYVNI